jgi:ribosomal protein S18 acetylase RimI-like enzyme
MARLQHGLPDALRPQAAALYWQAFGGKLGPVMGPQPRALSYLERVMLKDHVVIALSDDGALLGLAGFKTPDGSFAGGTEADLRAVYGRFGALWRSTALRLLANEVDNDRFLLDGICVAREARGQGVGSALLEAICDLAGQRGYDAVRLDVIDANWRARRLYERLGFVASGSQGIGLLRFLFGFASATTMVRALAQP